MSKFLAKKPASNQYDTPINHQQWILHNAFACFLVIHKVGNTVSPKVYWFTNKIEDKDPSIKTYGLKYYGLKVAGSNPTGGKPTETNLSYETIQKWQHCQRCALWEKLYIINFI